MTSQYCNGLSAGGRAAVPPGQPKTAIWQGRSCACGRARSRQEPTGELPRDVETCLEWDDAPTGRRLPYQVTRAQNASPQLNLTSTTNNFLWSISPITVKRETCRLTSRLVSTSRRTRRCLLLCFASGPSAVARVPHPASPPGIASVWHMPINTK